MILSILNNFVQILKRKKKNTSNSISNKFFIKKKPKVAKLVLLRVCDMQYAKS